MSFCILENDLRLEPMENVGIWFWFNKSVFIFDNEHRNKEDMH